MPQFRSSGWLPQVQRATLVLAMTLVLTTAGCTRISGNYPPSEPLMACVTARLIGEGFQLLAGPRLGLDQVEAELGQLKSQGFSRCDPQIIKSVARRRNVPPALLTDRSGCAYYRFTAHLDGGTNLTLAPGALEVTLNTGDRTVVVQDQGYLVEDRSHPGGCRPPSHFTLAFGELRDSGPVVQNFLVRLPVRGKIVGLVLVPHLGGLVHHPPLP
jgi:hypothetical protein